MDHKFVKDDRGIFVALNPNDQVPSDEILTMAFVNIQPFGETYEADKALCRGTLYPDLDKPFLKGGNNQ